MAKIVTLYTLKDNDHSQHVKLLLAQLNVEYHEIEVDQDEQMVDQLVSKTGQWSVPALVVEDDQNPGKPEHVVVGYEPTSIRKIFA